MSEQTATRVTTAVADRAANDAFGAPDAAKASFAAVDPRYAGLRDRLLGETLTAEDRAEQVDLDPLERLTCRTHKRWVHQCAHSSQHIFVVTGHRWCRECDHPANVAVDELTWEVAVSCPKCGQAPTGRATRQIVRTCRASMAAARGAVEPPAA